MKYKGEIMKVTGSMEFTKENAIQFIGLLEKIIESNYDCFCTNVNCKDCIFSNTWAADYKFCSNNSIYNIDMKCTKDERMNEVLNELKELVETPKSSKNEDNQIDFNGLEKLISEKIGTSIKFDVDFNKDRNVYILKSQDLNDKTGILANLYNSIRIENFGGNFTKDGKKYWLPLAFAWNYKSGGSNGANIAEYLYNVKTKKWQER
jgi:hypothetical protein